jgi:uncharacterized YigZ family protein
MIAKTAQAQQVIKKSVFIGFVSRTCSEKEALAFIAAVKQAHPKARHHCYAFLIGEKDEIQRQSDNGEPTGTAGVPILEVLKKEQLHNITTVVVRYFGGIKLGAGGLIRAYSSTTSLAINAASIIEQIKVVRFFLQIDYSQLGSVQNYLQKKQLTPANISYQVKVSLDFWVPEQKVFAIKNELTDLLNAKLKLQLSTTEFAEIPYLKEKD